MVDILIIDDEETICKSIKWTLEKLGHKIAYNLDFETGKKSIWQGKITESFKNGKRERKFI